MNRNAIEAWAQAIENQVYPKGDGYLNHNGCLCHLGVLCELAHNAGVLRKKVLSDPEDPSVYTALYGREGCMSCVPIELEEWLGVDPEVELTDGVPVIQHNDELGTPPAEVARLIRETFL